ncbi:MAG: phage integrase SAM-like domain-containing protein [Bacteroidales bacterium]|jgi:hypothetical protein|nr:phage integrase SAM-like domain-containing protein [Bacteroidales bacterium]
MATSFHYLVEDKRKDGTFRVKVQVIHQRTKRRFSTDLVVSEKDVTSSGKIKNSVFSIAAEELLQTYRRKCLDILDQLPYMSVDDVIKYVTARENKQFHLNFIEYGEYLCKKMLLDGRTGNTGIYQAAINSLKRFAKTDKIDISEITVHFLQQYIDYLKEEPNQCNVTAHTRQMLLKGEQSTSVYLRTIRAIFNRARDEFNDEDTGLLRIPHYPFKKIKIKTSQRKPREALSVEQMQQLILLVPRFYAMVVSSFSYPKSQG